MVSSGCYLNQSWLGSPKPYGITRELFNKAYELIIEILWELTSLLLWFYWPSLVTKLHTCCDMCKIVTRWDYTLIHKRYMNVYKNLSTGSYTFCEIRPSISWYPWCFVVSKPWIWVNKRNGYRGIKGFGENNSKYPEINLSWCWLTLSSLFTGLNMFLDNLNLRLNT